MPGSAPSRVLLLELFTGRLVHTTALLFDMTPLVTVSISRRRVPQ